MTPVPARLREIAENLNANLPLGPGRRRLDDPRFVVWVGDRDHPAYTVVQRLRLAGADVPAVVDEVREVLRSRFDRRSASWEVGSSAEPDDLGDRLLALGMTPFPDEPLVTGMVLRGAVPEPPPGVTARMAESVDDYLAAQAIMDAAFGMPQDEQGRRETAERQLADDRREDHSRTFLAFLGEEPVAAARATFLSDAAVMNGGATAPHARGRGAYRALLAARFAEATRRGSPALVTQAGSMSRPILERLGFEPVAQIRILVDEVGEPAL